MFLEGRDPHARPHMGHLVHLVFDPFATTEPAPSMPDFDELLNHVWLDSFLTATEPMLCQLPNHLRRTGLVLTQTARLGGDENPLSAFGKAYVKGYMIENKRQFRMIEFFVEGHK